jgi:inosine-uridine nucleoside N-ribohydrolase
VIIVIGLAFSFLTFRSVPAVSGAEPARGRRKIPVVLDTDIGDDIDDTWALALLLKSPELDLKMVVTDQGNTVYRAKIAAKLLEVAQRTDVPVGLGIPQSDAVGGQAGWVADYDLARYPGKVHKDGVAAMIRLIRESPEPITLICIGPMPNIRKVLEQEPEIVKKVRFVGMQGSVRKGYGGNPRPDAEYNVRADAAAAQQVFTAAWPMTITPLDTCGLVSLQGEKYRKVAESTDPLTRAVIENYRIWRKAGNPTAPDRIDASSVLFDTVAVYLAFSDKLLNMESLKLRVTDDGFTRIDPQGKKVECATSWKDLPAFEDFLVERLTGKSSILTGSGKIVVTVSGRELEVSTYRAKNYAENQGPMIVVFHGIGRDAAGSRNSARGLAEECGGLIVAPHFSEKMFPGDRYPHGNVMEHGKVLPEEKWAFSLVPPLIEKIREMEGRPEMPYYLLGHSAGGQFVERLMIFTHLTPVRAVAANPGTHTFPTREMRYPYGFGGLPEDLSNERVLKTYLAAPLTLDLGMADIDPNHSKLDKSRPAEKQGPHRLERGRRCFQTAKKLAGEKGWAFNWKLVETPGVGHSAAKMFKHPECRQALFGE